VEHGRCGMVGTRWARGGKAEREAEREAVRGGERQPGRFHVCYANTPQWEGPGRCSALELSSHQKGDMEVAYAVGARRCNAGVPS
jgi:hypothetical protein